MRVSGVPRSCGGHHPVGDTVSGPIRLSFNPQLRVEFRGATVTSDAGLLLPRELDRRLGLDALIERHLTDPRAGHNRQFPLADLFRQSIYSRLAGYEDTNDAERLAEDPQFRMLASRERRETSVALTSTLHWFETDVLTEERNYQGLARLNTALIQHASTRSPNGRVTLDIDSSESPVHGAQEQSACNGHFESVCYHPLFVLNPEGDCLAAKLRPGNVHSADGWDEVLLAIIDRYRARARTAVVRADAAFALPALYEALERRGVRYAIRLPANDVLERRVEDLRTRRRPTEPRAAGPLSEFRVSSRLMEPTSTGHRQRRTSPRRVVAAGGLHRHDAHRDQPGCRPILYNQRGTAERLIKEGKEAIHWTRLSCHRFRANEVRLLLGVIAYNVGNLLRGWPCLGHPELVADELQQRLFKTGGRLIRHARYFILQLAESQLTQRLFAQIIQRIERLVSRPDGGRESRSSEDGPSALRGPRRQPM